ncbi:hypothetical protein ABBQ38_015065 [Trebouxia sp. C0009 RCD-2024]
MDGYPDVYSHFGSMFPGMYRPGSARSVPQHAYAYDPSYDQYFPGSFHRQTPRVDGHANYEDPHLYHRQPRQFQGYYEPQSLPNHRHAEPSFRRTPHWHFDADPACIDLRLLPAFAVSSGSGQSARQQRPVGVVHPSQHDSPPRQGRSTVRQVPVEGLSAADVLRSQFPFLLNRYQNSPSRRTASHQSEAESDEDVGVEQPQDLASEQQRLQHLRRQQQEEEQVLRQDRAQEREHRLAQQLHDRELQKERERRLEQHLHEQRLAEEQERGLAYQHMQEQRLQQQLYQRRHEQELAEEELRLYEAAQRQHRLQQQRQEQQRQQQLAEALLQQQQELQRQEELIAAQQRQLLQQRQQREAQQAAAQQAAQEQKMHQQQQQQQKAHQQQQQQKAHQQQQQKVHQQQQQTQPQQQKPEPSVMPGQQQSGNGEEVEGRASVQQPSADVGSIIQKLMRTQSMRAEHPMVEQLAKANAKLDELSQGLRDVRSCVSALKATRHSQPAKLRQCQGQLGSPEQLQKRLVELGERSMQVVLSMDELHSQNDKVRSLRKCIVKKALAFMEDIDNIKSSMLHSILVPLPGNDSQSELSEPVSEAVSEASETAEEDARKAGIKDDSEDGAAAVTMEPVDEAVSQASEAAEPTAEKTATKHESESGVSAVTMEPVSAVERSASEINEEAAKGSDAKGESDNGAPATTVELVQQVSEATEGGAQKTDTQAESEHGAPAVTAVGNPSQGDDNVQQVADALATLQVAQEAAVASATGQQLKQEEAVCGGSDGEEHQNQEADNEKEAVKKHNNSKNA